MEERSLEDGPGRKLLKLIFVPCNDIQRAALAILWRGSDFELSFRIHMVLEGNRKNGRSKNLWWREGVLALTECLREAATDKDVSLLILKYRSCMSLMWPVSRLKAYSPKNDIAALASPSWNNQRTINSLCRWNLGSV